MDGWDSIDSYVSAINKWGIDRNITAEGGATTLAQMSKMTEEFAEFISTYNKLQEVCAFYSCPLENLRKRLYNYTSIDERMMEVNEDHIELYKKLEDDFGDILVCLIQAMRLADTDMEICLARAWDDIKDRKGTMVAGKFVKEKQ